MERKPIRRQSDKAKSNAQRRRETVAAARRRDSNRCQGAKNVPEIRCSPGDLQPHEVIRRSQWREGIFVLDNVVMLCAAHHRWVTDCIDLDRARDVGLFAWSYERERYGG